MSEHYKNNRFKKITEVTSLAFVALMLSSCTNHFGPFYVPSGYAHHNKEYKAPPGADLVAIPEEENETPVSEEIMDNEEPEPVPISAEEHRDLYGVDISQYTEPEPVYEEPYDDYVEQYQPPVASENDQATMSSSTFLKDGDYVGASNELLGKLTREFGYPVEPVYLKAARSYDSRNADFESALRQAMVNHEYKVAPSPGTGPFELVYDIRDMSDISERVQLSVVLQSSTLRIAEQGDIHSVSKIEEGVSYEASPSDKAPYRPASSSIPRESDVSYPPIGSTSEPVSLFEP